MSAEFSIKNFVKLKTLTKIVAVSPQVAANLMRREEQGV